MSFTLDNPFQYWNHPNNSNPIGLGKLYIGLPDTDPTLPVNQVAVFTVQSDGSELAISQPIQLTAGGIPSRNGTPVQLKINAETVSMQIDNQNNGFLYYTARWSPSVSASDLARFNSQVVISGIKALDFARKYNNFVLVSDYSNLVVSGDWTSAWNAALATGKSVYGDSDFLYQVSDSLQILDNQVVDLRGCTIKQMSDQKPIFNAVAKENVTIVNGSLIGKNESTYLNSPSSLAIGVLASSAKNLKIENMKFSGFYYSPLMVALQGENIQFMNNVIEGIPTVLAQDANYRNTTGCTILGDGVWIVNNKISGVASGIIVGQQSSNVFVENNKIENLVNEHGIYCDTAITNLLIKNNTIEGTGVFGQGIKVQIYNEVSGDCRGVEISGNIIRNTGGSGILASNTSAVPSKTITALNISDNVIINSNEDAISVRNCTDAIISDNSLVTPLRSGVTFGACSRIAIAGNGIRSAKSSAIRDLAACDYVCIEDNLITNPATGAIADDDYGIYISQLSSEVFIERNKIFDTNLKMKYALFVLSAINDKLAICDNFGKGAKDYGVRIASSSPVLKYDGNYFSGALGVSQSGFSAPSIASSTDIQLNQNYGVVKVTGTTNITNITAIGFTGFRCTMIFDGSLTVNNTGNIKLSAPFSASAGASLTVVCDGTFWYEA